MPWGNEISIEMIPYPILADMDMILAESYPVPAKQKTEIGSDITNRFEWKYFLRKVPLGSKQKTAASSTISYYYHLSCTYFRK